MDQQEYYDDLRLRYMRHVYSVQGWALLIYYGIMNAAVLVLMIGSVIMSSMAMVLQGDLQLEYLEQQMVSVSGWGYILAIGIGGMWLMLWKKPEFFFHTIFKRGKPMKVSGFFEILCVFMSGQMVFLLLSILADWVLSQFGISLNDQMAIDTDNWSLFLYAGLGAPVAEEILFRGLIMRSMEPFGKKFAVFGSALLFGIYHGNVTQSFYAFVVGLVLGYVAMEHNILWAMVLHMFNNLTVSDTLTRLGSFLPGYLGDLLVWALILGFAIAALVVLILRRRQIRDWFQKAYDDPLCVKAFFTAPGIIVLLAVMLGTMVLNTVLAVTFV